MKYQKLIGIIIILVIILICTICLILLNLVHNKTANQTLNTINQGDYYADEEDTEFDEFMEEQEKAQLSAKIQKVNNYNTYFTIKNILNNYISYFENINGDVKIDLGRSRTTEEEYRANIYKQGIETITELFDEQYTKEFTINEQKIKTYVEKYKNKQGNDNYKIAINEMYSANLDVNHDIVLVYSQINGVDFNCMLKLDWENNRYSIFWEDYLSKNNYTKDKTEEITLNSNIVEGNNIFIPVNANKQYIVIQYLDDLKFRMTYTSRSLYEMLEEEYKQKRFPTYESFYGFINDIRDRIQNLSVEKYKYEEDKIQILDNYNNIYTFKISNIMEYEILLDDYTIPEKDITSSYLSMKDEEKVYSNIEKFFKMSNLKDYNGIYNLLDDTFKNNNYKSLDAFKQYINQNIYNYSVISGVQSIEKNGNYYICTVKYKNGENLSSNEKNITIIMQLKENTDFVMSFSI